MKTNVHVCMCSLCHVKQPPMWVTRAAPPSLATWEDSTIHVVVSVFPSQGECTITQTHPSSTVCVLVARVQFRSAFASLFVHYGFSCVFLPFRFQRAQQNPGVQLLPDGPGRLAPSLRGRLVLPIQHGWVLRQPSQGCQIPQGPLTPRVQNPAFRPEVCWPVRPKLYSIFHWDYQTVAYFK